MRALLTLAVAVLLAAWSAEAQQFIVVTHADNPVTTIGREDLAKIFLKRTAKWPDGSAIQPIDLAANNQVRIAFTDTIHKKSVSAVRAFWQQQIFSGREVPPPEKSGEADVLAFVREHPGAVGYVSAATPLGTGVKQLAVEGVSR